MTFTIKITPDDKLLANTTPAELKAILRVAATDAIERHG